jgi:hypothetical protein
MPIKEIGTASARTHAYDCYIGASPIHYVRVYARNRNSARTLAERAGYSIGSVNMVG